MDDNVIPNVDGAFSMDLEDAQEHLKELLEYGYRVTDPMQVYKTFGCLEVLRQANICEPGIDDAVMTRLTIAVSEGTKEILNELNKDNAYEKAKKIDSILTALIQGEVRLAHDSRN